MQAKIKWPRPSKSLHYSYKSSDVEAVSQVYREAEQMTSSPCFFVTCKDFWWLAAVTMSVEKNTDHIPYSVKSISHNKWTLLLMLITKPPKPSHVSWSYCQHLFVVSHPVLHLPTLAFMVMTTTSYRVAPSKAPLLEVTVLETSTVVPRDINKSSEDTNSVLRITSRLCHLLAMGSLVTQFWCASVSSCIMWIETASFTRVPVIS